MSTLKNLIGDIVASPLGQVIAQVGQGVADAQMALDEASLAKVLEIYGEGDDEALALLRSIGYRPTFYTLPDTTGEVRVALRIGNGAQGAGNARPVKAAPATTMATLRAVPARAGLSALSAKMYAAPVDAAYANAYGYQADIAAKLTFRIVPVPPPDGADELRIVPDVTGRAPNAARTALDALGLGAILRDADGVAVETPADTDVVLDQSPAGGAILRLEDDVTLRIGAPD
ncbi:PASTA domain-containing protein [Meridianimarinicoccus sp. RP-17]|uniref:PASTA domain-containing protein n=1 Tax=Meridianimarinicoccus zhengii TaxID=2056810 RepID=UPI000DABE17B|nr:PASTA domain-containing protein [Phycocomes zhengii]